jgi:uncharacterized protein YndB with AHSA1/START domain
MTFDIEVTREIAASPQEVYAAITDITRMGEWSPETYAAEWNDGVDGPALGATFTGHNRNGDVEWSTAATIVDLAADERFFFDCDMNGFVFSKWGYTIEPTDTGCTVTEYSSNLIPEELREASSGISGVEDRGAHNRSTMVTTLDRLAAALE